LGDNIRYVINEAWPGIKEDSSPTVYYKLSDLLRNRVQIKYDIPKNLMTISFQTEDPNICYKVVNAVVDLIKKENKAGRESNLETGIVFLRKQLDFYKNKLNAVDNEIASIKIELNEQSSDMTDQERELIKQASGEAAVKATSLRESQKSVKYDAMLTDLNLQLLEAKKKKTALLKKIGGDSSIKALQALPDESFERDIYIKDHSKSIAERELAIAKLLSEGYMPAHPILNKLQRQVETIKRLKAKRIGDIRTGMEPFVTEETGVKGSAKTDLEDIDWQINTLKDKIRLIASYQKNSEDKLSASELKVSAVSKKISRLVELKSEKDINERYYRSVRKQLEDADLKGRIEKEQIGVNVRVVEAPKVPTEPVPFQKMPKLLVGLFIAFGTGAGLAYVADALDQSIKTSTELRDLLKVPVLASTDRINTPNDIIIRRLRRNGLLVGLIGSAVLLHIGVRFLVTFGKG
ncbi:MAG: hypothetical protein WC419_05910, partial [Candidatus Omnitrophota bacterium]